MGRNGRGGKKRSHATSAATSTAERGFDEAAGEKKGKKAVWQTIDLKSDDNTFVKYYGPAGINILSLVGRDESEWPKMLEALRSQLPSTFRVSPCGNFTKRTLRSLNQYVANIEKSTTFPVVDSETNEVIAAGPPQPIGDWCPGAWTSGTFRAGLRTMEPFRQFHKYLVRATETGAISRQEMVSMIPALLLDVKPGNWVLDMCAAPGSKSLQILEVLDQDKTRGVLVANDVDAKRAYMLTKRTKNIKNASLVVTTHDASQYPIHRMEDGTPLFDRILCDVPCSGDGTMRKNQTLWKTLKARDGPALHVTQLRIAIKAVQCLKAGGILVYSTCSFNPIEDEAVVSELLKIYAGEIELVDTRQSLPGLKRATGISKNWKVPVQRPDDDSMRFFDSFAEYDAWNSTLERPLPINAIKESMFAPSNIAELGMENCMRLLPHDQDSGGFFVAVFRKIKDGYLEKRKDKPAPPAPSPAPLVGEGSVSNPVANGDDKVKRQAHTNRNDVWYEEIAQSAFEKIQQEWGLAGLSKRTFRVRMDNRTKSTNESPEFPSKVSWCNEDVLKMFERADEKPSSLHVVHAGVLALQRGRGNAYRIANDYAEMFLPHVTKRKVEISLKHLAKVHEILKERKIIHSSVHEPEIKDDGIEGAEEEEEEAAKPAIPQQHQQSKNQEGGGFEVDIPVISLDQATQDYLRGITDGGLILVLTEEDQKRFAEEIGGTLALAAWWGNKSTVRFMVDKNEMIELIVQLNEAGII